MFNIPALMEHVARHLHTIVRQYTSSGDLLEQICLRTDNISTPGEKWTDAPYLTEKILEQLLEQTDLPKVSSGPDHVAYITISGPDNTCFLTGPVLLPDGGEYRFTFDNIDSYTHDSHWLDSLYTCNLEQFVTETILLYNVFHEKTLNIDHVLTHNTLTEKDYFHIQKAFTQIVFENQENSTRHNPYDQELREVASIRNGDLEMLEKTMAEDYNGTIGTLARTRLRNCQNLAIVLITLASRAAMEGGVLPEVAYSLSDAYIQKVEDMNIPSAAVQLAKEAEFHYASLVHEYKTAREADNARCSHDFRINQCKGYIFSHLHRKLSTSDIAAAMHMSPNYLSNLFKKEEGITITDYILNEKIKLVENMLMYSHYSYSTIATYLGFSSQSHLGRQFKQKTGMTLQQYRRKYGKKDFDFLS